jgi:hypothetical protein
MSKEIRNSIFNLPEGSVSGGRAWTPQTISDLVLSSPSDFAIKLDWTGGIGQTGYKIERTAVIGGGSGWTEIATVANNTYTDENLDLGSYYYRVRSYKATVYSEYSNVENLDIDSSYWASRYPATLTVIANGSTEMVLAWTNNGTTNFDKIAIEHSTDNNTFTQIDVIAPALITYSHKGLTEGTNHYYKIRYLKFSSEELVYLFAFMLESNSGGAAPNAELSSAEKLERSSVKILNNTTMLLENLHIGVNNLIDHAGFTDNATHGWENGLANKVEDNTLPNPSYLVKCGQGGSAISAWASGSTYYNKLVLRINTTINEINKLNKNPRLVIWFSQGINDILVSTNEATWKAAIITFLAEMRALYGAETLIIMTEFFNPDTAYNDSIQDIAANDPYTLSIPTDGIYELLVSPAHHWDSIGLKDMAAEMTNMTLNFYN